MAEMRDVARSGALPVESNRLVRNTFILLSMVLGVAAVGAGVGLFSGITWGIGMWIAFMVVFIGGPFLLNAIKNGQTAIIATFAWAGLVGFLPSPLVSAYLAMPGGSAIVLNALVTTAVLFVALAGYAVVSKRDFSFMGGFLVAGALVVLVAIVANLFLAIPMLSVVISAVAVMLMCGFILYDTSRLIHEPNANPIMITVSLFASITVLFLHLLNLFSFLSGDD